jgi:type II secretory pathway pseudopilin PulG
MIETITLVGFAAAAVALVLLAVIGAARRNDRENRTRRHVELDTDGAASLAALRRRHTEINDRMRAEGVGE